MSEVVMRVQVSGARDGQDWPAPGESLTVPAEEAESLIAAGLAKAADEAAVEKATATSRRK